MNDIRSIRNFLGLRLIDVERASGVSSSRISAAERGLAPLSAGDRLSVENFLRDRLTSQLAQEAEYRQVRQAISAEGARSR
jgi:transcriptional regulator with XRE-family HTH domain